MHLRTVFQCVPCDQRSSLVRDFFLFVCIMSMRGALDSCYFPRMPYACRFLDFRVRRFDNKLQVAFDSVRCWFVEVLLTSYRSWVVEVDVERRGGQILKIIQHGLLR